ncbi:leader peptidase (prepilin peptidase) / N-methyltransferase [Williamsia serinedens]|uniref:Leader peptidase (Prepilin peptidase) / N-methyltransferase n=2 Tax=Williamsia serinedens TaxID=391736 RepID=A0ABT1GW07_9NOCA|nr:leader peptidase (prepilin peptidase) / N-methyltransferase [Williamsia serinedens]
MAVPVLVWLLVLTGTDLRARRLPNTLTMPGVIAAVVAGVTHPSVAVAVAVAALPYLVAVLTGSCGAGDLKLAVVAGALAGDALRAGAVVALAAALTVAAIVVRCRDCPRTVAHGPALASALLVLVV